MSCEEKARLASEYETAAKKFAEAVAELQRGIYTRTEHERLNRIADEARIKSEQARFALEEHITAHDC
jgi:hypothetical protein